MPRKWLSFEAQTPPGLSKEIRHCKEPAAPVTGETPAGMSLPWGTEAFGCTSEVVMGGQGPTDTALLSCWDAQGLLKIQTEASLQGWKCCSYECLAVVRERLGRI